MPASAMMAIGDSLFNGVRSLTINEQLARWSAPAQVAKALGIPFAVPDYPRNVVVNFEQWLREFPNLIGIAADLEQNITFWDSQPASNLESFDNVAIASASYSDLFTRTWKTADAEIQALHGSLGANFATIGSDLAALFFAFNTRFLLNPASDPTAAPLTPLEIVGRRMPMRLLVSIGANNGLWNMGFAAEASTGTIGEPSGPFDQNDVADLRRFMASMKALPAAIRHIYVNALPMPSDVADMMPVPDNADTNKPGPGNYYPAYENRFGFNYNVLTGAQLKANDATVVAVNALVRAEAGTDSRIHVVPIDEAFASYNFKADSGAKVVTTADGKVLSNLMIEGPELLFPSFWRGGLMGLDGMHPTIVGYAIMAQEILNSIASYEGIVAPSISFDAAYQADTLLQKVPIGWDPFLDLSLDIRRASAGGRGAASPTGMKYAAVEGLLKKLQFKYD